MADVHTAGVRLAWLVKRVAHTDAPYLATGPQAAFEYHRWLTPLENLITLQVYAKEIPVWRQMAGGRCHVFEIPPTTAQMRAAPKAIILDPTLEAGRYRRRRVIGELNFVAPEDLCLDLLERARGETSLAEAVAIIIAQRDALAWGLLLEQAERRGLVRRLGALLDLINTETEADFAPVEAIKELGQLVRMVTSPWRKESTHLVGAGPSRLRTSQSWNVGGCTWRCRAMSSAR